MASETKAYVFAYSNYFDVSPIYEIDSSNFWDWVQKVPHYMDFEIHWELWEAQDERESIIAGLAEELIENTEQEMEEQGFDINF